jgi:hypothetical protein
MQCRNCGTEIADKAIICYRCGSGTTDPVRQPVPLGPRGAAGPSLLVAIAPLVLALMFLLAANPSGHPAAMDSAAGVLAAVGAVLLIARVSRRR